VNFASHRVPDRRIEEREQVQVAEVRPLHRGLDMREPALVQLALHPWTREDVARELGVTVGHVTRLHRRGLPHVKPFGSRGIVRYCPRKVRAWAAVEREGDRSASR
jgi:hypothetical protein